MANKKWAWAILLAGVIGYTNAALAENYGKVCHQQDDKLVCGAGNLINLNYLGDAVIDGTTITGFTKITGDLDVRHASLNEVNVVGDLKANDTNFDGVLVVKGDAVLSKITAQGGARVVGDAKISASTFNNSAEIIGDMTCDGSTFKAPLTLAANHAYMSHSNSTSIIFDPSDKEQYLTVNFNSTVDGDIKFTSQRGTVYLVKGSVLTGMVRGGTLVQEN